MNTSPVCPRCGTPLSADALQGLCPRCLGALPLGTETAFTAEGATAPAPPLAPEKIAEHFPQLEILEYLGRGGMGVVYKARQKSLGRLVALKLLAPEREKDPHFAERFAREAQALAQLDHPHIVTVYDFGQTNGFFYLLMEYVDGASLRELLRARKLSPEEALAIVPPLCEALQFAHERGIVHRDIKPENLLLTKDGRVKIADFGIAKMLGVETQGPEENAAGTPGYMAPEQKETPGRVDNRADIYSLGVVFYEMLTGELPTEKLQLPSRKVQVDVRIDEIVLRALEKTPERRYQTAVEMRSNVENVASSIARSDAPRAVAPAADRRWMRVLGWIVLFVLAIPLSLFGLTLLWLVLRDPNWHPSPNEAFVTFWSWAGALLLLAGSVALLWFSRRSLTTAGETGTQHPKRQLPALSPWQRAWLAQPASRRRWIRASVALAALALFVCFAWPRHNVILSDSSTMDVWSFGIPEPWLKEIKVFTSAGAQNWPEHKVAIPAFLAGIMGMALWITLSVLAATESRVSALADQANAQNREPHLRWPAALLTIILGAVAFAHGGLLMCALIPAPALLTMAMTAVFGVAALASLLLRMRHTPGRHAEHTAANPINQQPRLLFRAILAIAAFPMLLVLLYLAVQGMVGTRQPPVNMPVVHQVPTSHGISHIETSEHGIYLDQGEGELQFAIFHAGGFDPSVSRTESSHRPNGTWSSQGDVTTKGGRFFSFRRNSDEPDTLKVNGSDYDLRKGRVIVLKDDGKVQQLPLFPEPVTLQNLPALASQIDRALSTAPATPTTEPQLVVGRWYNFYPKAGVKPVNSFTDATGWKITIHSAKLTQLIDASTFEVTFPSDPQKHFDMITARARDSEANGQPTQDGAAFREWEGSVREWTTRRFKRSDLERITPIDKQ